MKAGFSSSRRSLMLALAALGLQACGARISGAQTSSVADEEPYRFERFTLKSRDGQRHYRVDVGVPAVPPPAEGHPLLVMLDGNAALRELTPAMLSSLSRASRPPVIAALGYETTDRVDAVARAYDYTPPVPGRNPTWDDEARGRRGGGADEFLDLYEQEILPELIRRVSLDASRSMLWGHSYGGLLALHALFTRPGLFARYAAADPSLWWHGGFILQQEARAAAAPAGRPTRLLLMAGSAGEDVRSTAYVERAGANAARAQAARDRRRSVPPDAAEQMAQRLAGRMDLEVEWLPFPGVSHGPMRAASLPRTLEWAAR